MHSDNPKKVSTYRCDIAYPNPFKPITLVPMKVSQEKEFTRHIKERVTNFLLKVVFCVRYEPILHFTQVFKHISAFITYLQ
jgi:hypothetical protein